MPGHLRALHVDRRGRRDAEPLVRLVHLDDPATTLLIAEHNLGYCGGVNLALGDGSVRFVAETLNIDVWKALCTPKSAVGEVVGGQF